jgi:hypothetical protein
MKADFLLGFLGNWKANRCRRFATKDVQLFNSRRGIITKAPITYGGPVD